MTEQYAIANDITLAYDEFGQESDPAILLIMGLGTQMTAWPIPFCQALADAGFRVIRFDNRDIGLSEKMDHASIPNMLWMTIKSRLGLPLQVAYTLQDMADDAVGLLDALGIAQAHIVGASMGGMIGQLVAANAADRVLSFTSIMSTSGARRLPAAKPEIARALLRPPPETEDERIAQRTNVYRLIGSVGDLAPSTEEIREKVTASIRRSHYPAGYSRHMAAILDCGSRVQLLKKITCPTLVIHGKADPLVNVEAGIDTARHIAGARLELIDNMGHDLPAPFMLPLAEMIASHAAGPE